MRQKPSRPAHNTDKHLDFKAVGNGKKIKVTQKTTTVPSGMRVRRSPQEHR